VLLEDLPVDLALPFSEVDLVQHIGVLEHPFLQRNENELRLGEPLTDHVSDVLGVRQVKSGVYLVQDVEGRRLVQEEGKDEGKS
jgi:hypothetical protein